MEDTSAVSWFIQGFSDAGNHFCAKRHQGKLGQFKALHSKGDTYNGDTKEKAVQSGDNSQGDSAEKKPYKIQK